MVTGAASRQKVVFGGLTVGGVVIESTDRAIEKCKGMRDQGARCTCYASDS